MHAEAFHKNPGGRSPPYQDHVGKPDHSETEEIE